MVQSGVSWPCLFGHLASAWQIMQCEPLCSPTMYHTSTCVGCFLHWCWDPEKTMSALKHRKSASACCFVLGLFTPWRSSSWKPGQHTKNVPWESWSTDMRQSAGHHVGPAALCWGSYLVERLLWQFRTAQQKSVQLLLRFWWELWSTDMRQSAGHHVGPAALCWGSYLIERLLWQFRTAQQKSFQLLLRFWWELWSTLCVTMQGTMLDLLHCAGFLTS